ncbi:MAG: RecX family transcriptional regulator [Gemmatimonadaceae bacterium]|nr:RecX family transcriptional regulator [Gemmatimonadaceae bacterium]MCW5825427.1 RecX family transcriptional regulator [Gemmatimonadaceae bacterium]
MTDAHCARISELRESARRPGRYDVRLEPSGEKLPVSIELIAQLKLNPGRELNPAEYARLVQGARAVACYDKALATLGARARSSADLKRWLKTKDFTDAEIAPVTEKLTALGLLDDREYARSFARSRLAPSRGFGPRRVAAELAKRGVPRAIVDETLAEHAREQEAEAAAIAEQGGEPRLSAVAAAAAKKMKALEKLEPEIKRRRLYGYLARRGFSGAEIGAVLRKIGRGEAEGG